MLKELSMGHLDSPPRVSVIMAARNSEGTIIASVLSLQRQTMTAWELVVIDDASSDRTSLIVSSLATNDSRISLRKNLVQTGTGHARALGVKLANAPIVAFLDSDDLWLPHRLEEIVDFMESDGHSWVHSAFQYLRVDGSLSKIVQSRSTENTKEILGSNPIALSTVLIERDRYPHDLQFILSRGQDWQTWVHLASTGLYCEFFASPGVIYRIRHGSVSSNKLLAAQTRLRTLLVLNLGPARTLTSYLKYLGGSTHKYLQRFKRETDNPGIVKFVADLEQESINLRNKILSNHV